MNILYVCHYAGSPMHGMSYRPYYLSREWVRQGHNVTIVAASQSHLRTVQPSCPDPVSTETLDGIRYCWFRTPSYNENGFARIKNMLSFVSRLWLMALEIADEYRPDVVIASSTYPLDIYPARRIARRVGAKLVFEVHDLWPLSPMELGKMSRWHPFIMAIQIAEDCAYRSADRVISMLPNAKDHMVAHFMSPEKFHFVPNGLNLDEWGPVAMTPLPEKFTETIRERKSNGAFLVGYAGGHGLSNALDQVLDAAGLLLETNVVFVLVGKGPEKERLAAKAFSQGLNNVIFLPPVPKSTIPSVLAEMDILYLGWKRNPLYRFGICPNKLMDYMMAAKPVVHAVEAANDLVADSGCGLSVPPENPGAIAEAVRAMQSLSSEDRTAMGKRGHDYVVNHHGYQVLADNFLYFIA